VPHNSNLSKVRFGPFEIDLHTCELRKRGVKLKLSGQAFKILAILLERPGELVTREELRERLWPADTFVDFEQGVNTSVKTLRQVIADSAGAPVYIETLPRRGYRFVSPVEYSAAPLAAAPQITPTPKSWRSLLIASVLLFFVLLAIGAGSLNRRFTSNASVVYHKYLY
jgi:DNA-binding winged helix-turn-helix (wHTH) protein